MCQRLFLFLFVFFAAGSSSAWGQKIIEKTAVVANGQRVFLNLRQASSIRIRAGANGQMLLKASVSINQSTLNDALLLAVESAADGLTVTSALDTDLLRNAPLGECPTGSSYYGYMEMTNGENSTPYCENKKGKRVCTDIQYDITLPVNVVLRVSSLSGDIDIAGLTGPIEAKSLSGFVDVAWPPTQGAELLLKTISGEVYTDQDVAFSNRRTNPVVGYQLRGTLQGSGPLVRLESISNDVYFRKQK